MTKDCSLNYQFIKYMKTTSSEHVVYTNCFLFLYWQFRTIYVLRAVARSENTGAWITVVGIICPPGWDRVNGLAKNLRRACVHNMFWAGSFHVLNWQSINNLSYCGLVAARIRASDKYLLVCTYQQVKNQKKRNFWNIYFKSWDIKIAFIIQIL